MSATFAGTVEFSPALQFCFQGFVATIAINNIVGLLVREGGGEGRLTKRN